MLLCSPHLGSLPPHPVTSAFSAPALLCAVLAACGFSAFAPSVFLPDIQSLVCSMNELNRSPRHLPHTKTPIAFALCSRTPARASSCFHEFPPVFPAPILVFSSVLSSGDVLWPLSLPSPPFTSLAWLHRHAQRYVSLVCLCLAMLTIAINHHISFGYFVG